MKDIISGIALYREKRSWTEYPLVERSNLPQSTVSSWYRNNMTPSQLSLSKICDTFDITLSQLFSEGDEPGSPDRFPARAAETLVPPECRQAGSCSGAN